MDSSSSSSKATTMSFIPTFGVYANETDPLPLRVGFNTLRGAIIYANSKRKHYVIRRSRYIPEYGVDGVFYRGMIVHTAN